MYCIIVVNCKHCSVCSAVFISEVKTMYCRGGDGDMRDHLGDNQHWTSGWGPTTCAHILVTYHFWANVSWFAKYQHHHYDGTIWGIIRIRNLGGDNHIYAQHWSVTYFRCLIARQIGNMSQLCQTWHKHTNKMKSWGHKKYSRRI